MNAIAIRRIATLAETRRRLRSWPGPALIGGISVSFAFVSMLVGQMLTLEPVGGTGFVGVTWSGGGGRWWDFPELVAVQPWGFVVLPFLPTVVMVLVSLGVGVGGAVGALLLLDLRRSRSIGHGASSAGGAAAGVSPAITGLATLGACCCTGCAGAAGLTVMAAVSGTQLSTLLLDDWYVGIFQLVVVYVALVAQERVLRTTRNDCAVPPPLDGRFIAGALLRVGLLVAGITWSLSMFVEWGEWSPLAADGATWFHWIFEHQLLAVTAVSAGLFPEEFTGSVRRFARRPFGRAGRLALGVAGITWGIGVPAVLVGAGLGGTLNEWVGVLGLPDAWGAATPDGVLGPALYFHWLFQHLLLAGFALSVALDPVAATRLLSWTTGADRGSSSPIPPSKPRPIRSVVRGSVVSVAVEGSRPHPEQGGGLGSQQPVATES